MSKCRAHGTEGYCALCRDKGRKRLERLDALRYRFLRGRTTAGTGIGVWREDEHGSVISGGWLYGRELDIAINAARKRKPHPKRTSND